MDRDMDMDMDMDMDRNMEMEMDMDRTMDMDRNMDMDRTMDMDRNMEMDMDKQNTRQVTSSSVSMDTAKDDISLYSVDEPSRLYSMFTTLEITQDDIYDYMMKQTKNYRRGDQGE